MCFSRNALLLSPFGLVLVSILIGIWSVGVVRCRGVVVRVFFVLLLFLCLSLFAAAHLVSTAHIQGETRIAMTTIIFKTKIIKLWSNYKLYYYDNIINI